MVDSTKRLLTLSTGELIGLDDRERITPSCDYSILAALPAEAYAHWEIFMTPYDNQTPGYAAEQEAKGMRVSREYDEVIIAVNSVWSARTKGRAGGDRSLTTSEGIGYHANTYALLRGLLSGTARVVVYRRGVAHGTVIKQGTAEPTGAPTNGVWRLS